jgi:hypothetical protein
VQFTPSLLYWPPTWYSSYVLSLLYWLPVSTVHTSLLYWLPLSAIYIQPAVLSTTQYSSHTARHSVQFNIQPAVLSTTQYSSHPICCSFHRLARFTPSVLYCSSFSSVHTQPVVLATARNSSHSACCTGHHSKQLHPASCTGHRSTA